ncbi:hypothetical protein LUZ61_000202 [Rhynchospora tenuis]|uniref:Ubiquitin-specific protease family C19-related protein n=1 Tax=Rhynchospora tenuis TaxID=198213 RepID=A0AAD5ZEP6_9POAL|nr:hypothetical protein LUZ61_000202 [Rhynchospora tenuis]
MSTREPGYYLSSGLYVSGRPDQPKEKTAMSSSIAAPYTGGDVKNSDELGKMFDIPAADPARPKRSGPIYGSGSRQKSGPMSGARQKSGPVTSQAGTGTGLAKQKSISGPINKHGDPVKRSSGPLSGGSTPMTAPLIPATGLITSGPLKSSGPLNEPVGLNLARQSSAVLNNSAVTKMTGKSNHDSVKQGPPRVLVYLMVALFLVAFGAGAFIFYEVKNMVLLAVVGLAFLVVLGLWSWNWWWGPRTVLGFMTRYADAELRSAKNGQLVKVTGIVTCGNVPLETSFEKVSRCVYTSSGLYEYHGWGSKKSANPGQQVFSWGCRFVERHVVDFYVSDFQSGLRALIKAGNGAKVIPFVDEHTVSDTNAAKDKNLPPELVQWLTQRNLSSDDRSMRIREGFIKEGSTVSVMGVVQRNDSVLMIVPPSEPVSTGCQWARCLLPATLNGIVIHCEEASEVDVIPV